MIREIYEQPPNLATTLGPYIQGDAFSSENSTRIHEWLRAPQWNRDGGVARTAMPAKSRRSCSRSEVVSRLRLNLPANTGPAPNGYVVMRCAIVPEFVAFEAQAQGLSLHISPRSSGR